jgi:all-trans-retinol 13,14-reductase
MPSFYRSRVAVASHFSHFVSGISRNFLVISRSRPGRGRGMGRVFERPIHSSQELLPMPTECRLPTPLRIFAGFLPYITQGALAGRIGGAGATIAALGLALVLVAADARRGRVKLLEAVGACWFAGVLAAGFSGFPLPVEHGTKVVMALLSVVAWSSLAVGRPFTEQYAREEWPEALWTDPGFRAVNRLLTALWGVIFAAASVLLMLSGGAGWGGQAATVLTLCGSVVSATLPPMLARRRIRKRLAAAEPTPWLIPGLSSPRPRGVEWDVAVIGAGIAGLSAAALLARSGKRVLVCEAHDRPGGCCSQWTRRLSPQRMQANGQAGTFVFDAGVHDISGLHDRGSIRALLRRLGVEHRIRWLRMEQEIVTAAGTVRLGHGRTMAAAALGGLHPRSAAQIAAFLEAMEGVFHDMYGEVEHTNFIPRMPRDVEAVLSWPRRHPLGFKWMDRPFAEMLAHYVEDGHARRTLSYLCGYLTDRPETLTVRRMAPVFGILFAGGHYPAGGSQTLADLLAAVVAEHGGEVRLKAPVAKVLMENGAAAGLVLADGRVERSRVVVGAGDAKRTMLTMVGADRLPPDYACSMAKAEPASSAFMVMLAVAMVPDGAPLKFLHNDHGRGMGIMVPSLVDPSLCPPGHAAITLIELVPQGEAAAWDRTAADYRATKKARGDALVARAAAAIPGLQDRILYREDATPRTFERYVGSSGGSIYGLQLGGFRPHRRTPVPGLFLAGHGTELGAGVEAAAISGMLVAEDLGAFDETGVSELITATG